MRHSEDLLATRVRFARWMYVGMWLIVLALLTVLFGRLIEGQHNPNRDPASQVSVTGIREVALERNRFGHYVTSGAINGEEVSFMLDTGASDVAVPARVARRLGLRRGAPITYQTANGLARGYVTTLATVRVGAIELKGVRASINPNTDDDRVLLGMSFLKHLEIIQRGKTLTLRQQP